MGPVMAIRTAEPTAVRTVRAGTASLGAGISACQRVYPPKILICMAAGTQILLIINRGACVGAREHVKWTAACEQTIGICYSVCGFRVD